MRELLMHTVIAALPVTTWGVVIAGLVVAVIIAAVSIYLFRSSGKKKGAKGSPTIGRSDWQSPAQQGSAGAWNQPGASADNAWNQQPAQASQQPTSPWGQPGQQAGNWGQPSQQPGAWN